MTIARSDWPRLLTLVEQALDLPASEREGWLRALDLSGPLQDALRGLLDQRRAIETDDFLAALPVLASDERAGAALGRLAPGTLIGPWRLQREVGQGGMSTVWLAERADEQVTRQVALKLPHAGPGQDLLARRLLRERNILAALEHPNIARLYDVGLTDAGTPYLVMEFVQGETLLAHADARRLGTPQRLALFLQVLRAVQYAHGKLVLHRDLKPSNILVTPEGEVKLLDFGIAKVLGGDSATHDETELTRAAGRQLTPGYASPEQWRGQPLGTASDVYSLGVLLYELLCGLRPHAPKSGSAAQLEEAVVHHEARAPSRRTPEPAMLAARSASAAALRKTLSGDLDTIVLKALAKRPEERYASADALGADIGHWLAGEPIGARAPSAWYYLDKFVRRHRLAVGLGLGAGLLLVLAGSVALVQAAQAQREAARAIAARDFMIGIFDDTNPDAAKGRDLSAKEVLSRSRAKLLAAAARGSTALPVTELLNSIADAQLRLSDPAGAEDTLKQLLDTLPPSAPDHLRLTTLLGLTQVATNVNHLAAARRYLGQALAEALTQGVDRPRLRQLALVTGQLALYPPERVDAARTAFAHYFGLADTPDTERPQDILDARLGWAKAESLAGQRDAAFAQLALVDQYLQANLADLAGTQFRPVALYRASIELDWGQYARTHAWLPDTVQRCAESLGSAHDTCLALKAQDIRVLLKLGEAQAAAALAPALQDQADNDQSPRSQLDASMLMARSFAAAGKGQALQPARQRLIDLLGTSHTPSLSAGQRLLALNALAEIDLLTGQLAQARNWTAQARHLASSEPGLHGSREALKTGLFDGLALQAGGQHAAALAAMAPWCDEARLADSKKLAVLNRLFSLNCARPMAAGGRRHEALALVRRALPVLNEGLGINSPVAARASRLLDELNATTDTPVRKSTPIALDFFS